MSFLLGAKSERLPLAAAFEYLGDAARWARMPGLLWLAGIFYPGVVDAWSVIQASLGSLPDLAGVHINIAGGLMASLEQFMPAKDFLGDQGIFYSTIGLGIPMALLAARLSAGLARSTATEGRGSLKEAWQAGYGFTRSTLCIWALLAGLLICALMTLVLPLVGLIETFHLREFPFLLALLVTPALVIVFAYAALLQIVQQLALHSLVQNNRGVSSALTHGWRLVYAAPWSATRAGLSDLCLVVATLAVTFAASGIQLEANTSLINLFAAACMGFLGVVRAAFWFRVYRALGGQCEGDHLHGIGD